MAKKSRDAKIAEFCDWAESHRWEVRRFATDAEIPAVIASRYENAPKGYLRFLQKVSRMATPDGKGWFNCKDEFDQTSASAEFQWNAWERLSLEAIALYPDEAEGATEREIAEVRRFWDTHLPLFLDVSGHYAFFAINIRNGTIVYGCSPSFEDTPTEVASSFTEFLELIMEERVDLKLGIVRD